MDPYELELGIAEMGIGSRKKKWVSENHGGEMCEWEWSFPPASWKLGLRRTLRESNISFEKAAFQSTWHSFKVWGVFVTDNLSEAG